MQWTKFIATVAASGLFLLTACGGGGGDNGRPVASTPGPSAPTLSDAQSANPEVARGAASRAGGNLPRFGSVTQSSNSGRVSGITGDSVSTSFDGSNVRLTVSRENGSRLAFNSAADTFGYESFDSGIPGHTGRTYGLLDYTDTTVSVAAAYVSWDNIDHMDYLAGGYWMHLEGSVDPFQITGAEVGAFVDGPELSSAPVLPNLGTASYSGSAGGLYAQVYGTDAAAPDGSTEIGEFSATAELTANFASMTIFGCVGCSGGVETVGIFHDASTGETYEVYDTSDVRVQLRPAPISSNGNFRNRDVTVTSPGVDVTSTSGSWGGQFSNIPDAQGDPRLVAGTFGGEVTTSGGTETVFVGAYAAPGR